VCQQFGVPLVEGGAVDQPYALTYEVLVLRSYAEAKAALDRAKDKMDIPQTPMIEMVWEIMGDLWLEKRSHE